MADADTVYEDVCHELASRHHVTCVGRLGFENTYALAMRRARAEALGVRTIDDLAKLGRVQLGGDYEFFARPEWTRVQHEYGLDDVATRSFDVSLLYDAVAHDEVDVITAFSSDGRIAAYDLVVLEDVRHALPPYDAVLLVGRRAAKHPGLEDALRPLVGTVSVELMRGANQRVDVEHQSRQVAGAWLWEQLQEKERSDEVVE